MRVEHYWRTENGFEFVALTGKADRLHFDAVEFGMLLEAVYFGVEL